MLLAGVCVSGGGGTSHCPGCLARERKLAGRDCKAQQSSTGMLLAERLPRHMSHKPVSHSRKPVPLHRLAAQNSTAEKLGC